MTTAPEFGVSADETNDRKRLVIAGGVAAALVLGAGGYFLMSGGSEDVSVGTPLKRPATKTVKPAAKAPAKKVVKATSQVPAVSAVKLGRDPFVALYTIPVAAPAAPPAEPTVTEPGTDVASEPYGLKLLSVTGSGEEARVFTFSIDGVKKAVVSSQRFGKYGELIVLAYTKNSKGAVSGAVVQVGDDDPVVVAIGETITVL